MRQARKSVTVGSSRMRSKPSTIGKFRWRSCQRSACRSRSRVRRGWTASRSGCQRRRRFMWLSDAPRQRLWLGCGSSHKWGPAKSRPFLRTQLRTSWLDPLARILMLRASSKFSSSSVFWLSSARHTTQSPAWSSVAVWVRTRSSKARTQSWAWFQFQTKSKQLSFKRSRRLCYRRHSVWS